MQDVLLVLELKVNLVSLTRAAVKSSMTIVIENQTMLFKFSGTKSEIIMIGKYAKT